jgi:adenine-specific DNA-methyltransferase
MGPVQKNQSNSNFHVLEALTYTHRGMIDAIYIDPPYNTGASDWKYNNNYVEKDDLYRHSKWLAMMERRLAVAKELLNPADSVLIVTIDEKEYLRLGLLLEQVFPEARLRMISTQINPKGVGVSEGFKRVDEYVFIARFGSQDVTPATSPTLGSRPIDSVERELEDTEEEGAKRIGLDWQTARRRDLQSVRRTRPGQFYPIYVNESTGLIDAVGDPIPHEQDRLHVQPRAGCIAVFPVRDDGTEMNWSVTAPTFIDRWKKGYARAGKAQPGKPQPYIIQYLKSGPIADIEEGRAMIEGYNSDGSVIAFYPEPAAKAPPTQWNLRSHNAEHYGTKTVRALLAGRLFPFPKSLCAVEDVLRLFVSTKPEAIILDFFAGSGTTAHAVMRLNRQDGGRRQCISVTNNEVAADEQAALRNVGLRPGDLDWEKRGICDYITKPRIAAAITGKTPEGNDISGSYRFIDEFPMADGFEENAEFFTLTYESHVAVSANLAFQRIAPLLWMRAGSVGRRIDDLPADGWDLADTYGLLVDLDCAAAFCEAAAAKARSGGSLRVAYLVTDDDRRFQAVARSLPGNVEPVRLYETYLSNFRFSMGR